MKKRWLLLALLMAVPSAFAGVPGCDELVDGQTITKSLTLCSDTFQIPSGVTISGENIVLDCNTAVLRGLLGQSESGIRIENSKNITLRNCNVVTFARGLFLNNVTNSLIEKNSFLKNKIGIRLYKAYENTIQNNNDKSFDLAISAIASRFNVVHLANKRLDDSFCEFNSCNSNKKLDPCVSGDFYCSDSCEPKTDSDCGSLSTVFEPLLPVEDKITGKTVAQLEEEIRAQIRSEEKFKPRVQSITSYALETKALIGLVALLVLVASFIVYKKR